MASDETTRGGQTSLFGFSVAAALLTALTALISISVISPPRSPVGVVFANAAIVGFAVFLPYGWFYLCETNRVVERLNDLFRRMHGGEEEAIREFALLTFRMKKEWSQLEGELVRRTLKTRARFYLTLTLVLFLAIGIWVGQETARQQGLLIWEWRSIAWQWP